MKILILIAKLLLVFLLTGCNRNPPPTITAIDFLESYEYLPFSDREYLLVGKSTYRHIDWLFTQFNDIKMFGIYGIDESFNEDDIFILIKDHLGPNWNQIRNIQIDKNLNAIIHNTWSNAFESGNYVFAYVTLRNDLREKNLSSPSPFYVITNAPFPEPPRKMVLSGY